MIINLTSFRNLTTINKLLLNLKERLVHARCSFGRDVLARERGQTTLVQTRSHSRAAPLTQATEINIKQISIFDHINPIATSRVSRVGNNSGRGRPNGTNGRGDNAVASICVSKKIN